jgi:hypothetical protein
MVGEAVARPKVPAMTGLTAKFPAQTEQGIHLCVSGIPAFDAGNLSRDQGTKGIEVQFVTTRGQPADGASEIGIARHSFRRDRWW